MRRRSAAVTVSAVVAGLFASTVLSAGAFVAAAAGTAQAASVSKSIDIKAPADKVWALIGPFCAIKDWHPVIGQCTESAGVRTLTSKDGKMRFVEKQTAADAKAMSYSYMIETSPLPISDYLSTIKVLAKGKEDSTVVWSSTYTPKPGQEQAADAAISGIYQAGLDSIQKMEGR